MSMMSMSLPEDLESFVDQRVTGRGYGSPGEYIHDLIRKDQDRRRVRALLLEGEASPTAFTADADYFGRIRDHIRSAGRR